MKTYEEFVNERKKHKLSVQDRKELYDFLYYVLDNMESQPNLLRSAIARIKGVLNEIRMGNCPKSELIYFFQVIHLFIEGRRTADQLRTWANDLRQIDLDAYDDLLSVIHQYNHLVHKYKDSSFRNQVFNIKSWIFEGEEGIRPIGESKDYEKYCDFGCGYIRTYLDNNPDIDEDEFGEYVTVHNRADRDMGELQDVSKEEIERLGKEFKKEKK